LLHAAAGRQDWAEWLAKHRVGDVDTDQGLVFDQPHLALQAAADGLGVAMADQTLAQSDLASGRLVKPFDSALSRAEGYYVVGRPAARDSAQVGPFWRWLIAEAAARPAPAPRRARR
jgi:LysR family glycine cleavage system transcriptional activator